MNSQVDQFLEQSTKWREVMVLLRGLILECGLKEEFKWKNPCYTFNGKNVVIMGEFKDYCGMSFFKGALLKDDQNLLVSPGKDSHASRLFKFKTVEEVKAIQELIQQYIFEAIEVEKAGLQIKFKKTAEYDIPIELTEAFDEEPAFKDAWDELTDGRKKGYLLYFSAGKQIQTRKNRIEKYKPRIFNGKGLQDCVCGHSGKMPRCDGTHKNFQKV